MSFGDFVTRYEHKFLRNIYTEKEINNSEHIKHLQSYYEIFDQYIDVFIGLLALLNNSTNINFINVAVEEFVEDNFAGEEINEIKNTITKTEIKNLLLKDGFKNVPKFNLKLYAYVYNELIIFPRSDIQYDPITTNKFFLNVHRLIRGKFHIHHSHITSEIHGRTHDFCNTMLVECNNDEIPFIAHNFFGFDLFYFMKCYIACIWGAKELNIGVNNLTLTNYGNVKSEIKLTDSLKFYQKSLGELSSTLTNTEKKAFKKLTEKFLNQHYCFCTIWPYLSILSCRT